MCCSYASQHKWPHYIQYGLEIVNVNVSSVIMFLVLPVVFWDALYTAFSIQIMQSAEFFVGWLLVIVQCTCPV